MINLIKKIIPKLFYNKLKDYFFNLPVKVLFFDNKFYKATFKIKKMFFTWRNDNMLSKEAKIVYNNYNGGDIIDVGSYFGFYSFLLAPKAKSNDTFLSFEPDPIVYSDFLYNLAILNKVFNKINYNIIQMPVSNTKFTYSSNPTSFNSSNLTPPPDIFFHPVFKKINKKNYLNIKKINSCKIDNIVAAMSLKPVLIKIDVEGNEFEVLKSMQKTLKKFKPNILLEKHPTFIDDKKNLNLINRLLIKDGYKAKLICKRKAVIREYWSFIK
jgi:FkbM family methyltransferase